MIKGKKMLGSARTGGQVSASFNLSKAYWTGGLH